MIKQLKTDEELSKGYRCLSLCNKEKALPFFEWKLYILKLEYKEQSTISRVNLLLTQNSPETKEKRGVKLKEFRRKIKKCTKCKEKWKEYKAINKGIYNQLSLL